MTPDDDDDDDLHFRCVVQHDSWYSLTFHLSPVIHLKNIALYVDPASTVERESNLTLVCVAEVIHSDRNFPLLKFSFFKDYNKHNTVHILQTNTSAQVTYTITRAHVSHSGQYQCDVTANNQHKESSTVSIIVKGAVILALLKRFSLSVQRVMFTQ